MLWGRYAGVGAERQSVARVVVELEPAALQRLTQELLGLLADTFVGHVDRLAEVDLAVLVLGCLVEVDDLALTPVEQSLGLGASGVHATLQRAAGILFLGQVVDLAGLRTDLVSGVAHTAVACVGVGAGSDERAATDCAAEGFVQAVGGVLGNVAVGVELAERVAADLALCQLGPAFAHHAEHRLGCRAHTLDTSAQRAAGQLAPDDAREDGVHRAARRTDEVRRTVQVLRRRAGHELLVLHGVVGELAGHLALVDAERSCWSADGADGPPYLTGWARQHAGQAPDAAQRGSRGDGVRHGGDALPDLPSGPAQRFAWFPVDVLHASDLGGVEGLAPAQRLVLGAQPFGALQVAGSPGGQLVDAPRVTLGADAAGLPATTQ